MKIKELIHFLKSLPPDKEIEELEMTIDQQVISIRDILENRDTVRFKKFDK